MRNGSGGNLDDDIYQLLHEHKNSLRLLQKAYDRTGNYNHPILRSLKEKVVNKIKMNKYYWNVSDKEIAACTEEAVIRYLHHEKLSDHANFAIDFTQWKKYIRRYPALCLIFIALLLVQYATYYLSENVLQETDVLRFIHFPLAEITMGDWYRFITYPFVQPNGIVELLTVLILFAILAPALERIYGTIKFPLLFIFTGTIVAVIHYHYTEGTVLLGATGLIFGLAGAHLWLALRRRRTIYKLGVNWFLIVTLGLLVLYWLAPQVTWQMSLASLATGFVVALFIPPQSFQKLAETNWALGSLQAVLVFALLFLALFLPDWNAITSSESAEEEAIPATTEASGTYLLQQSASEYLQPEDISHLSKEELRLARNEIYARHGFIFGPEDLTTYFTKQAWYEPNENYSDALLSDVEHYNVNLIMQYE